MYLKTDKIQVNIGDNINIYSHNAGLSAPKYLLDPTAIIGWSDGVDVKKNTTSRPISDGDFAEPGYFNSRLIIITGTAIANTVAELHQMRDEFIGILSDNHYDYLTITDGGGTRYTTVSLANKTAWVQQLDTVAYWKLELYAPDPRIYSEMRVFHVGSSVTTVGGMKMPITYPMNFTTSTTDQLQSVTNHGNVTAWPLFEVTGDFPSGFTITDNVNGRVTYTGQVAFNSPVLIDMAKGTATQNFVDKSVYISERKWFGIRPGVTISPEFHPIVYGPGWCDIIHRDTWI